jgi:hypothetical protein
LLKNLARAIPHVPWEWIDANSLPAHLIEQVGVGDLFAVKGTDIHVIAIPFTAPYRKRDPQILLKLTVAFLEMRDPSKCREEVAARRQFVGQALQFISPADFNAEIEQICGDRQQADREDRASQECRSHAMPLSPSRGRRPVEGMML